MRTLERHGYLHEHLFDLLCVDFPSREAHIRSTQRLWLPDEPVTSLKSDPTLSAERRAFRERLRSRRVEVSDPTVAARGWIDAAAVLDDFDPAALRPFGAAEGTALSALAPWISERPDGRWVLQDRWRDPVLARLAAADQIAAAQAVNPGQVGRLARYLGQLAAGDLPDPASCIDMEGLADLLEALRRLGPHARFPPDRLNAVLDYAERRRIIEPLRRLTGTHFRGRADVLAQLREHVAARGEPDTFTLWGPGGVGKSTLLGALLLEQENAREPAPFVYLDFDHGTLDPLRPRELLVTAARQLRLLYSSLRQRFLGLESAFAGDRLSFTADVGTDLADAAVALAHSFHELPGEPPFLIVFDTFERVQARGEHAVARLRGFVDAVRTAWPRTRVVLSGRAPEPGWPATEHHLDSLSTGDAVDVLQALGVGDPALAATFVKRLGTNPLTLRLAAEVTAAAGASAVDGIEVHERLVGETADELVQQMLYTRILGHLGDREIEAFAHPGLVVRRITPAVLADVLAEPCGLDPARLGDLFTRLTRQRTLLTADDDGALRHRSDVRVLMLRSMLVDPAEQAMLPQIHARALAFYAGGTKPAERAEWIYHALWLGRPDDELTARWSADLVTALTPAWDEPLPAAARAWLAPRIGRVVEDSGDQVAWELRAAASVRACLADRDPAGALAVLRQRPWSPESPLAELEIDALVQADAVTAGATLDAAIAGAAGPARLRRLLWAMRVLERRRELTPLDNTTAAAIDLARDQGDAAAELQALTVRVRRLGTTFDPDAEESLTTRFLATDEATLRRHPALVAELLRVAGPRSAAALQRGVALFGNTHDERGLFAFDVFAVARLFELVLPAASADLDRLARELGLPGEQASPQDVAGQAIRYGRLGDALALVLTHGGDRAAVREGIVGLLNPNLGTPRDPR